MKHYELNSPEAMARIVAMMIVTDGDVHPHEIELLEDIRAYDILGLSKQDFTQVFHDFLSDLSDDSDESGHVNLLDSGRLDDMLNCVTDPKQRLITAAIMLDITKADHDLSEAEIAVFRYMLAQWKITLDDIQGALEAL